MRTFINLLYSITYNIESKILDFKAQTFKYFTAV